MTYYVSTSGNDSNPGTQAAPFKTWEKLSAILKPGDTAYIRGGTEYRTSKIPGTWEHVRWENLKGTATSPIRIEAEPGFPKPVLNLDNVTNTGGGPVGVLIKNCTYLTIKGLRITGLDFDMSGPMAAGVMFLSASNIKLENVEVDHIGGYGYVLLDGCDSNNFLNCDASYIQDSQHSHANGFSITGGVNVTNTTFEGCRAWFIDDDGWDFFDVDGSITIKNCWSFFIGLNSNMVKVADGNGFKLGPTADYNGPAGPKNPTTLTRILHNCIAAENTSSGFNQNEAQTVFQLYNNLSYKNGTHGFVFLHWPVSHALYQFKNNISYLDYWDYIGPGNVRTVGSNNSWNNLIATAADFVNLNTAELMKPRKADGSLPDVTAFKLSPTSKMLNKGVNVGLPFSGTSPDLGPFESGTVVTPPPPPPPPPPPTTDVIIPCSIVYYDNGTVLKRVVVTSITQKPDGYYIGTTKRDIHSYKDQNGKWRFL